jgi:rSAM/selenodomain-associated transferase 1
MNQRVHIAVFTRAPVAGASKTRLVPLLGQEGAAAAQRAMTLRTLETACSATPGQVSLWTAGDPDHPFLADCAARFGLSRHPQGEGDLGIRMAHCLRSLLAGHDAVLLIGTDCPVFSAGDLQAAATALRHGAGMVFTPAEDGGYVLVGAAAQGAAGGLESAFAQAFRRIDWGTSAVMAQTRTRLRQIGWRAGHEWQELPVLWDVDTPADYIRAQQERLLDF